MNAREKHRDNIARLATKSLAEHKLKLVRKSPDDSMKLWRCRRPTDGMYWFEVATWPGTLTIGGDIDYFVFMREPDMVGWVRKAIDDRNYLAGKCVAGSVREESREVVEEWIAEVAAEQWRRSYPPEAIEASIRETKAKYDEEGAAALLAGLSPWFDGADPPDFRDFTAGFHWCCEALQVFLRLLDENPLTPIAPAFGAS